MIEEFDIAISGYGPTGASLAHLLGQCGLKVLVLERESSAYHLPRAVHFDAEIMRVFQWIGIAEQMEPLTARHPGMRFVDGEGKLLLDWPRPQGIGPQGWRSNFRFHQPDLEAVLRREITRHPNVVVRTRCELFMVEEQADGVELRYEDMSRGKVIRAKAKYLVGCDGARSLVRRFIESDMEDHGFHERWLVADLILTQDKPELGDHSVQYCRADRPATYVRCPGARRRWEITVLPNEDSNDISRPERVWDLLADWITPEEATIERTAVYVFHSLVAKDWRKGRLLLAGDSCHQTPPFMGQGMCAGIRDVANLYWKLALLCKGQVQGEAAEALLASYEDERKPNAREYIQTAVRLGGLINTADSEAALKAAFPMAGGGAKMESIAPSLGAGLGTGAKAGCLFGQPRLTSGALMDDTLLHRFVLVADSALLQGVVLPQGLAVVTEKDAPDAREHLERLGVGAALLRPDRHVLAHADSATELALILQLVLPDPLTHSKPETV